MKTYSSATLQITPLSPVHVGTSLDYEPTNYVIDDDILYHFETDAVIAALAEDDKQKLLAIVSASNKASRMIQAIHGFFYDQREKLIAKSAHALPVSAGIRELYEQRIKTVANKERDGQGVINKLEIERTFYNPFSYRPIIPGSSIKGAIRTAVLSQLNESKSTRFRNKELQEQLLKTENNKLQTDPFRLISLADASYELKDLFSTEIVFAVDRKKKKTIKDGKVQKSMAEDKGLYQLLEIISPLQHRAFQSTITIQDLQGINIAGKTPDRKLQWSVVDIARMCNQFYQKRFEEDLNILKEMGYLRSDWEKLADDCLYGEIAERLRTNSAFLLRVGRHSGAESVTLDGVRSIRILKGKNNSSGFEKNATTFWLAAEAEKDSCDLSPFGWLLVEIIEEKNSASHLNLLETMCQKAATAKQSHQQKVEDDLADKKQKLERFLHDQQILQHKEHEERQEELRRQDEEKTKWESLSPEQRIIESFGQFYNEAKKRTNGEYRANDQEEFNAGRRKLCEDALAWTKDYRKEAAILIQETIGWTGWPKKKERKAELKDWLEKLEST